MNDNIIVIKIPDELQNHSAMSSISKVAEDLGKATGCKVFVFPIDSEVLVGKTATRFLWHIHKQIHQALNLEDP